jgi:hypothetical protein
MRESLRVLVGWATCRPGPHADPTRYTYPKAAWHLHLKLGTAHRLHHLTLQCCARLFRRKTTTMSLDGDDDEAMDHVHRQARYEGEDSSATTAQELRGWYAYTIAVEVFAVVAVGT